MGEYIYNCYYGDANIERFFVLTLKSDGTFTHEPSNEQTKSIVDMETLLDGRSFPTGWIVKETPVGKAAFLDFGGNWDKGSITPNKKVLQIDNKNGIYLKVQLRRD